MIRKYYTKLLHSGVSCSRESMIRSWMVGTFIAFSPFVGFHSIMVLISSWLMQLNIIIVFAVAYGINNPWTMVPIYAFEYGVGYGIVHKWLAIPIEKTNPLWMMHINDYIRQYVPIKGLSIWAFLVGGHVVSLFAVLVCNIVVKRAIKVRVG